MKINLSASWQDILGSELNSLYFQQLHNELNDIAISWSIVLPGEEEIFNAYNSVDIDDVRVVILGQDPYHGLWQAHWFSFSVRDWVKIPPSLKNIYKEIQYNVWGEIPETWDISMWASQWVFLLNSILTVTYKLPASHRKIGWEKFTDATIKAISDTQGWVVFMLWWNYAKSKTTLIDESKHLILQAPHPSPLSAYTGFFWCKHFIKANDYLKKQWYKQIKWLANK